MMASKTEVVAEVVDVTDVPEELPVPSGWVNARQPETFSDWVDPATLVDTVVTSAAEAAAAILVTE